jgi:hypothetical protein
MPMAARQTNRECTRIEARIETKLQQVERSQRLVTIGGPGTPLSLTFLGNLYQDPKVPPAAQPVSEAFHAIKMGRYPNRNAKLLLQLSASLGY